MSACLRHHKVIQIILITSSSEGGTNCTIHRVGCDTEKSRTISMGFANVLSSGGTYAWSSCFLATFSLQRFDWLTRVLVVKGSSDSAEWGKGNKLGVETQRFVDDAELVI